MSADSPSALKADNIAESPPGALETATAKVRRGLEALLKPDARVVYENLFSTRHLGRVIDLVLYESRDFIAACANSEDTGYRIRQLAELAVFLAWTNYRKGEKLKCVELECGWDDTLLVFSVSSYIDPDVRDFMPAQNPKPGTAAARIQRLLQRVRVMSDGIAVRHHPERGRFQAFAFVGKQRLESIPLSEYEVMAAADEDEKAAVASVKPLASADVEGFNKGEDAGIEASARTADDVSSVIKGQNEKDNSKVVIKGSTQVISDVIHIKGGGSNLGDVFGHHDSSGRAVRSNLSENEIASFIGAEGAGFGSAPGEGDSTENVSPALLPQSEEHLKTLIQTVRVDVTALNPAVEGEEFDRRFAVITKAIQENYLNALQHAVRVREIQTHASIKQFKDKAELAAAERDELQSDNEKLMRIVIAAQKAGVKVEGEKVTIPALEDLKGGSAEAMKKILDAPEVPAAAKPWAKAVMEDLLAQRIDLGEKKAGLEKTLKKIELDTRNRETALTERIRVLDEQLKAKDFAIKQGREALANAMTTMESARKNGGSLGAQAGRQTAAIQRELQEARESRTRLEKRANEWQKKLGEEVAKRKAFEEQKNAEINQLTQQRDRALKVADEQQEQIKDLQSKLAARGSGFGQAQQKGPGGTNEAAELKYKLDQANKIMKSMKDEIDRYRKRFDELKLEETNLRVEIGRLQAQLKKGKTK